MRYYKRDRIEELKSNQLDFFLCTFFLQCTIQKKKNYFEFEVVLSSKWYVKLQNYLPKLAPCIQLKEDWRPERQYS